MGFVTGSLHDGRANSQQNLKKREMGLKFRSSLKKYLTEPIENLDLTIRKMHT